MDSNSHDLFYFEISSTPFAGSVKPMLVSELFVQLGKDALAAGCKTMGVLETEISDQDRSKIAQKLAEDAAMDFLHLRHGEALPFHSYTIKKVEDPASLLQTSGPTQTFRHSKIWLVREEASASQGS